MNIKIKYSDDHGIKLTKTENGDFIDLRAAEDTFCPVGELTYISLGVAMQLPEGYHAEVVPRSSTFKHYGLLMANSVGIIDNTYCGDNDVWKFPAFCLEGHTTIGGRRGSLIEAGDRLAQFRIVENMPAVTFEEVDKLEGKSRGGFGSTGRR